MVPDRFTRSASVVGDKHERSNLKLEVHRQISIDSGIADYEEDSVKFIRTLDSEGDMSEEEDFEDAEDFDFNYDRKNALVLRTQLFVRVHAVIGRPSDQSLEGRLRQPQREPPEARV